MKDELFRDMPIPQAVLKLVIPTMLGMIVTIIYNMVDTFFVGQTGDPMQVAAVSLASPIFMLLMAFGNIFGIGGASLISRLLGMQQSEKIKKVSAFCFYGCVVVGLLATVIYLALMPKIIGMIGASNQTWAFAEQYLIYIAYGAVFVVIQAAFGNIVRSEGAAKEAMIGMMIGTIVNIILDPIMILTLGMGVSGAAIATVIGNICSVAYYIYYLSKKETLLSIHPKYFTFQKDIVKDVFFIGVPASVNNVLMSVSMVVLNNYVASYGDIAVSAMGISNRLFLLLIMLQLGVGMGIQPLVGYNYASRNYRRMNETVKFGGLIGVVIGVLITGIFFVFAEPLIRLFIDNADVVAYGKYFLKAQVSVGPIIGFMFIFMGSFQSMGKSVPALVLSVSRQGFAFFPIIIIANAVFGLNGVAWAQPAADVVSTVLAGTMYFAYYKKAQRE